MQCRELFTRFSLQSERAAVLHFLISFVLVGALPFGREGMQHLVLLDGLDLIC